MFYFINLTQEYMWLFATLRRYTFILLSCDYFQHLEDVPSFCYPIAHNNY